MNQCRGSSRDCDAGIERAIRFVPSGKISRSKSELCQQPARIVRALTNTAADPDFPVVRKLVHPLAQLPQRNIDGSIDGSILELTGLSHIEVQGAGVGQAVP